MRYPIAAVVAIVVALSACDKEPPPRPKPPAKADFQLGEVKALDAKDRPEAAAKATEQAAIVVQAMNAYYDIAFVNPKEWAGGKHTGITPIFSAEAQPQVAANVGALALGDLAPKLKRIQPQLQKLDKISFLIEDDLSASSAIVSLTFQALGSTKTKSNGPVDISHRATFLLTPEAGTYKIAAFFTEMKADTQKPKKAAFGEITGTWSK